MSRTRLTEAAPFGETVPSHRGTAIGSSDETVSLPPGFILADRYEILGELGRGGMGAVFKARQIALDREVAIKVMLPSFASMRDFALRFEREARIMSAISHRNIASVFDYGTTQGMPFLVLELLHGVDLESWLGGIGRLPTLAEVDEIMRQAIDAFVVAHEMHVVHRDVKPGNMFLARGSDGTRTLKVLDFGLARLDDSAPVSSRVITQVEMVSGTPAYMSPEQCRSLQVGASSDLYALGCVLTELLQGEPPFQSDSVAELLASHMFRAAPPLERPSGSEPVPHALESLRLDLLSKQPTNRPASAADLRTRWNLAMHDGPRLSVDAGREARIPRWTGGEPVITQRELDAAPLGKLEPVLRVAVVRVGTGPHESEDRDVALALTAANVHTTKVEAADVIFLDAAGDLGSALLTLTRISVTEKPTLVAIRPEDGSEIAALVAAGAADVVAYPIDVAVLAPKLRRLRARARGRRSG